MGKKNQYLVTGLATFCLSLIGFVLFQLGLTGLGYTFFIGVPIGIGYFLGLRISWNLSLIIAAGIGFGAFFILLITAQLEGMLCIVMLLPLFVAVVLLGIWIGYTIRELLAKGKKGKNIRVSLYPLLILLFTGTIEHFFTSKYEYAKVESTIHLPYDAATVYDFIKSVDTLNGEKSLLMYLGLPVPKKCILDKEEVGAKRICYFDEGTIEEKVTEIKRGELIRMTVTDYKLPGFKWLKFDDAIYRFTEHDGITELTRITTYRSQLKPRVYWEFWEKRAIQAQHEYVLYDLKRRLDAERNKN